MLGEIEQNLLDRLAQAQPALGYQYGSLLILNASFNSDLAKKLTRNNPALWLHHDSHETPPLQNSAGLHFYPTITLWFQTKSLFNQGLQRQKSVPGLYQLMLDAVSLLSGETLKLPIAPLKIKQFEFLPNEFVEGKALSVGKIGLQTSFTLNLSDNRDELKGIDLMWLNHKSEHFTNDSLTFTKETI
ncbi:MAG: DUF1834 family protein [Alphaproteobacteria bacterium]|nr:DUF1834 family protein [Alphaproteobacteria bacterium]